MRRIGLWSLLGLLWAVPAEAGTWWVETSPTSDKAEASALEQRADSAGFDAKVVRRYENGWIYLVRVDGFSDEASATTAAQGLAVALTQPVAIYVAEGQSARQVGDAPAASPTTKPPEREPERVAEVAPPADAASEAAAEVLAAAVKAHGGAAGGSQLVDKAATVVFRYRRAVPNGPTVDHVYAKRGDDLYLEVDVVKGDGASSKAGIAQGKAWLSTGGAASSEDGARTREQLERFAPETVVAFALEFASAVDVRKEFQAMTLDGTTTVDGVVCDVLRYSGDRASAPVTIAIDHDQHLVRRVTFASDAGDLTHEFSDYRTDAPGLVVPHHVRTWRGTDLVDDVQITELSTTARVQEDWFRVPGT